MYSKCPSGGSFWCSLTEALPLSTSQKDPSFPQLVPKIEPDAGFVRKGSWKLCSACPCRVFISSGGYLGCQRVGCSCSHKTDQPQPREAAPIELSWKVLCLKKPGVALASDPTIESRSAFGGWLVFLITSRVVHLSQISKGEGVRGNICCKYNSEAFQPTAAPGKEKSLHHAWYILSRAGEGWEFRLLPAFPGLPEAYIYAMLLLVMEVPSARAWEMVFSSQYSQTQWCSQS